MRRIYHLVLFEGGGGSLDLSIDLYLFICLNLFFSLSLYIYIYTFFLPFFISPSISSCFLYLLSLRVLSPLSASAVWNNWPNAFPLAADNASAAITPSGASEGLALPVFTKFSLASMANRRSQPACDWHKIRRKPAV